MASITTHASYDDIPYDGGTVTGSHPEHLATIGRLFGMAPAPVEHCRVLEIGCGTGANMLPMAYSLPGSTFVGIDPSRRQIEIGLASMAAYGVTNANLVVADVRDAMTWPGEFDYIVCHGVLTWVPPEVQAAILAACRRLLAPHGIAYVSYNALPGFHLRAGVGEMLRFHARNFREPTERIEQSKALLSFLVEATSRFVGTDELMELHHGVLKREQAILDGAPDSYLMHEHLVESGTAFYLHGFVNFAREHSLQYLGDAVFSSMLVRDLPDDLADQINEIAPDQVTLEQYRDFVVNRMFRKSLVCRDEVQLERHISPDAIRSLSFRARLTRGSDVPWQIARAGGLSSAVTDPHVSLVLDVLDAALPEALGFSELAQRVASNDPGAVEQLPAILLSLYALDAVDFRTWTPEVALEISQFPEVFLPARRSARPGVVTVPLPYHTTITLDEFVCRMLPLLDGTRDRAALSVAMQAVVEDGTLSSTGVTRGAPLDQSQLERLVDSALEQLLRAGLLVR